MSSILNPKKDRLVIEAKEHESSAKLFTLGDRLTETRCDCRLGDLQLLLGMPQPLLRT